MTNSLKTIVLLLIMTIFTTCGDSSSDTDKSSTATTAKKQNKTDKKKATTKRFYTSSVFGFKIQQPEGWEVMENQMENVPVSFINRSAGSFSGGSESVTVAVDNRPFGNLETYYEVSRDLLVNSGQMEAIVEESQGNNAKGLPFKTLMFTRKGKQGPVTAISYLYFQKEMGFVVTCSAPSATFDKMMPYFNEVATSITF